MTTMIENQCDNKSGRCGLCRRGVQMELLVDFSASAELKMAEKPSVANE
jgi:hypothetical protein